jgi:hypothetical protein
MRGIYSLSEMMLASHEELCCLELLIYLVSQLIFIYVISCRLVRSYRHLRGTTVLQDVGNLLPVDMTATPQKSRTFSTTPVRISPVLCLDWLSTHFYTWRQCFLGQFVFSVWYVVVATYRPQGPAHTVCREVGRHSGALPAVSLRLLNACFHSPVLHTWPFCTW